MPVHLCIPFINFWIPETNLYETRYVYHGTLHKPLPSVSVSVCVSLVVSSQRHGTIVTAATNTHVTIEELLDV
jgi:hypothetical protein